MFVLSLAAGRLVGTFHCRLQIRAAKMARFSRFTKVEKTAFCPDFIYLNFRGYFGEIRPPVIFAVPFWMGMALVQLGQGF